MKNATKNATGGVQPFLRRPLGVSPKVFAGSFAPRAPDARDVFLHLALAGVVSFAVGFAATPVMSAEEIHLVADEWPPFSGSALREGRISLDVIRTEFERVGASHDIDGLASLGTSSLVWVKGSCTKNPSTGRSISTR